MKKWKKKLSLRQVRRIGWTFWIVATILYLVALYVVESIVLLTVGSSLMVAAIIFFLVFHRCPYCNAYLWYHRDGDYCSKCGKRVFWDNHDDFQDLEEQ